MKTGLAIVGVSVLLTGCSTLYQPYSDTSSVQSDKEAAFNCSIATLNSFGYTLLDANKEAGFIKAERQQPPRLLVVDVWFDQLTVSLFADPSKLLQMRVVGSTNSGNAINETSGQVKADVRKLLATCAKNL